MNASSMGAMPVTGMDALSLGSFDTKSKGDLEPGHGVLHSKVDWEQSLPSRKNRVHSSPHQFTSFRLRTTSLLPMPTASFFLELWIFDICSVLAQKKLSGVRAPSKNWLKLCDDWGQF